MNKLLLLPMAALCLVGCKDEESGDKNPTPIKKDFACLAIGEETEANMLKAVGEYKRHWREGLRLKIGFMNGTETQKKIFRSCCLEWLAYAYLDFDFVEPSEATIRVSFEDEQEKLAGAAYVGTFHGQCKDVSEPTVWIYLNNIDPLCKHYVVYKDGVIIKENEYWRYPFISTVRHEIGHVLGLRHEHQSQARPFEFIDDYEEKHDYKKVYEIGFKYTEWDPESIMHYNIDPSMLKEGDVTVIRSFNLSKTDKAFMREWYPFPNDGVRLFEFVNNGIRHYNTTFEKESHDQLTSCQGVIMKDPLVGTDPIKVFTKKSDGKTKIYAIGDQFIDNKDEWWEGTPIGYAYKTQEEGSVPVWQLYNEANHDYMLKVAGPKDESEPEVDGYKVLGVAFYAFPNYTRTSY